MVVIFRKCLVMLIATIIMLFASPLNIAAANMVDDMFDNENKQNEENNSENMQFDNNIQEAETAIDSPSFLSSLFKLIVALAIVIGLIVLISKVLQKRNGFLRRHQVIENYGGITVGANKSIQTIKIADQFFVIGVGENVELLMEITDQQTIEQLVTEKEEMPNSINTIKEKFKNSTKKTPVQEKQNFEMLFNKELNTMKESRKRVMKKWKERQNRNDH